MLFGILGANRTEDLLVARNEIVSSCYSIVSFSLLLFFFLPILCTRFLENGSTDLDEIFMTDVEW